MRPAARAKGISLEVDLPTETVRVQGDRARLQQIVWNLLSNGVKFTARGGSVSVSVTSRGTVCEIRVSDTGAGIAPSFLPYVFDRFRQADGSPTRAHGGLGLGLAIVKELTELHGGTVDARSRGPQTGSLFIVRLPAFGGSGEGPAAGKNTGGCFRSPRVSSFPGTLAM
jgi:signal transduction histidine kinase